LSLIFCLGWS